MNNNIVNNETDILCYRLRTARQRKRAVFNDYEKQLRALDRKRKELWQRQRNLGWIELTPPVMRGWKRYFVLREDVAESIYADFFQGILDRINTYNYSNRRDFKVKKKRVKKWKYEVAHQEPQKLYAYEFRKMNFSLVEKSFFEKRTVMTKQRIWTNVYTFREPWRFILKIEPNWVYRTRIRSEEMESEKTFLENHIRLRHLETKLYKFKGGGYRYYHDWQKHPESKDDKKFRCTPLAKLLDEVRDGFM